MNFRLLFILLVFVLHAHKSNAQSDCACEVITLSQCDSLASRSDSALFTTYIKKLSKSNNVYCKILEKEMQINYLISKRNTDFLEIIQKQESLVKATDCSDQLMGVVYRNYAVYYKRQEDYENLSKIAFAHLAHAEKTKSRKDEISALKNIIHLFTRQNEDKKLPSYLTRARKLIYNEKENAGTAEQIIWLAMNYETLFVGTGNKKYLDTSFSDAGYARDVAIRIKDTLNLAQAHRVLEALYYHQGKLNKAIAHIDSAIDYLSNVNMPLNLSSLYLSKSWNHVELGEKSEAIRCLDTSIAICKRLEDGSIGLSNIYMTAAEVFEELGETERAYSVYKKHVHLKDSLFSLSRSETINELEQKYFKAKNEKTIKELSQQQKIYWLLIAAALFGLIALVFFIRQQALKNKQKILETEQRLNRARMNPHFFFNALSSIQSYALQGHDGLSIASNISKFSNIMRETLESTYKEYVTIEEEIEFLTEYLELQQIRFPDKYQYEIKCDAQLDESNILIPSMILQPFVENSIEHGFASIEETGLLKINFEKENDNLIIEITDNGKGLLEKVSANNDHVSRAGQIIKDRIYLLNLKLKTSATFSIENRKNLNGVIVFIKLPFLKKSDMK